MKNKTLIGLGGNLPSHIGAPKDTLCRAAELLEGEGLRIHAKSSLYQTAPIPASDQPDFINAVISAETELTADELITLFQKIEIGCGRKPAERWSARTLDIDLLAYSNSVLPNDDIWHQVVGSSDPAAILKEPVVPHPRLHKRAFVIIPLLEIEPNWKHPVTSKTPGQMLETGISEEEKASVVKLSQSLW